MSIRDCVQCAAPTRGGNGPRCKNRTCMYAEFCQRHTRMMYSLYVRRSTIPNSGMGLFTAAPLRRWAKIVRYTGREITRQEDEEIDSGYGIFRDPPHTTVIDAASTQSTLGRYVNDCNTITHRAGHCAKNNAQFFEYKTGRFKGQMWVVALCNIPAHTEIFCSYGILYWQNQNVSI